MNTLAAPTVTTPAADSVSVALRRAQAALILGTAAAIALAAMVRFVTTTADGAYQHTGDYFLTSDGIPYLVALLVLLPALRTLQHRRDGGLGKAGIVLTSLGSVALLVVLAHGLAAGTEDSLGPTYVLASLATSVGVALFAAGSWRVGLLPRWLLALWVIAWAIGGLLPILGWVGPLLVAAVYLTMAALLPRGQASLEARPG